MISELVVIVVLMLAGLCAVMAIDPRFTWATVFLALPIGSALATLGGLVLVVLGAPKSPVWVLGASLLPVFAFLGIKRPAISWTAVGWAALTLVVTTGLVALFFDAGLVNLTADSYRNMSIGSLIAKSGNIDVVAPADLHKRALAIPLIYSLADLSDDVYLRSFSPLTAFSGIGALLWLGTRALGSSPHRWLRWTVLGAGASLLITNHRFVFNAFYVNGHMTLAVWLLIMVGCLWLVATDRAAVRLLWLSALIAPALAVIRPESSLVVLLALVPVVSSCRLGRRWKSGLLGSTGAAVVLWHLVIAFAYKAEGPVPVEILAMALIGLLSVVIALVLWFRDVPLPSSTPHLVAGALVVGLAAFAVAEQEVFANSWNSTVENVVLGEGFYGYSLVVLAVLVSGSYLFRRVEEMSMLVFAVVTALPFGFLMGHLRGEGSGGGYRVGPGDSLNRMLLHWLPLAVFSLIVMYQSRPSRLSPWKATSDEVVPGNSVVSEHEEPNTGNLQR
jgi:hypothetical protein